MRINLYWTCFHALFCFSAAPAIESLVYTMTRFSLLQICLFGYAIILYIGMCQSCDPIYLNKLEGIGTLYHETQGPPNASKSLSVCSQWCLVKASCKFLSWDQGSCWQVGFCGTLMVTGVAYGLKTDHVGFVYDLEVYIFVSIHVSIFVYIHLYIYIYRFYGPTFKTLHNESRSFRYDRYRCGAVCISYI